MPRRGRSGCCSPPSLDTGRRHQAIGPEQLRRATAAAQLPQRLRKRRRRGFIDAFAVQAEGQNAAAYEIKENASRGFNFTLKAQNGEIIGVSQQYTSRAAAEGGIASLKTVLPTVVVL